MKRTIVRMRQCLLIVAMWMVAVPATATMQEPGNYQFYSTSALSGSQSGMTHSHLGQNGSVRVSNTQYYIQDYQQSGRQVSGRVYSASAFHTPTVYTTTSGGAVSVGAGTASHSTRSQGNSLNATVVKVSMPALAVHEKNAEALAGAAQADDESQAQIRRVKPINGDEYGDMPVGDALLPLLLMAIGYVLWRGRKENAG